jgi:N utilization substance protein B
MLFQLDASDASPNEVKQLYRACFAEGPLPDSFSIELFDAVSGHLEEIDTVIEASSQNWRLERMSCVDRNILRIGISEILNSSEIPTRVAINEAVELAKRYGTEESPSFVNGILDRVARDKLKL